MTGPAVAEPFEEATARSAAFAEASVELTRLGRRAQAIAAALKGLPAGAEEPDLEPFAAAETALFRAIAARVVVSDGNVNVFITTSPDGNRVVTGGFGQGPNGEAPAPYLLHDPLSGTVIAELAPFEAVASDVYGPGAPPAVSPDGSEFAFWHMTRGEVLRFAARDGAALPTFAGAGDGPGYVIGYSSDGTTLAAEQGGRIGIWSIPDGGLVRSLGVPSDVRTIRWLPDGRLVGLRVEGWDPDAPASLWVHDLEPEAEWDLALDLTGQVSGLSQYIQTSDWGPQLLLDADTRVYLADLAADRVVDLGGTGNSFHRFIRNGDAVAVLVRGGGFFGLGGALVLRVTDLTGAELGAETRDWAVFDQFVTTSDAAPDNFPFVRKYPYLADDVPLGTDLVALAESLLDPETLAEVAAERVDPD